MAWKDRPVFYPWPCCLAVARASHAPHVFDAVSGMPWQLLLDPLGRPSSSCPLAAQRIQGSLHVTAITMGTDPVDSCGFLWNANETMKPPSFST